MSTRDPRQTPDPLREEEARARREFGVERLAAEEELIDSETFAQMHERLTRDRTNWAEQVERDDETVDLILEEIVSEPAPEAAAPAAERESPHDSADLARWERALLAAEHRDEVVRRALGIARYHAEVAALFVVQRDLVAGLRGAGGGIEASIDAVMIPLQAGSRLLEALAKKEPLRLARAALTSPVDQRVLKALGRQHSAECAVLPIAIGGRVVNLLYVDNGEEPLAETALAALAWLADAMGRGYERMIRRQKGAPSGDQPAPGPPSSRSAT